MKMLGPIVVLNVLAIFLVVGYALAGGGAPVPAIPESSPPAGRPGGILDDATCEAIWDTAEKYDGALMPEKAAPFVTNFHAVDTNNDKKVSLKEFKLGCKNGWIEEGSGSPLPTKNVSPDVSKE